MSRKSGNITHIDVAVSGDICNGQSITVRQQDGAFDVGIDFGNIPHIHIAVPGHIADQAKLQSTGGADTVFIKVMFCQRLGSDGTEQITFGGTGKGIDVLDPPQFTANIAVRVAVMIVFVTTLGRNRGTMGHLRMTNGAI